jgi:hypothetical protein
MIAWALSMRRPVVSLIDLQTVYGVEDLYDLIEVGMVNTHNERVAEAEARRRRRETER